MTDAGLSTWCFVGKHTECSGAIAQGVACACECHDLARRAGEVRMDFGRMQDATVFSCMACDFETDQVEAILAHLRRHGVTRVTVIPENYQARRRR